MIHLEQIAYFFSLLPREKINQNNGGVDVVRGSDIENLKIYNDNLHVKLDKKCGLCVAGWITVFYDLKDEHSLYNYFYDKGVDFYYDLMRVLGYKYSEARDIIIPLAYNNFNSIQNSPFGTKKWDNPPSEVFRKLIEIMEKK